MSEVEFDTAGVVKNFMYVNRKAPYGTIYALEVLEAVLISAAFEQNAAIVFVDDGVFQIKKDQDTTAINMKNFSPTYGIIEMEKEDAEERKYSEVEMLKLLKLKQSVLMKLKKIYKQE